MAYVAFTLTGPDAEYAAQVFKTSNPFCGVYEIKKEKIFGFPEQWIVTCDMPESRKYNRYPFFLEDMRWWLQNLNVTVGSL